MREALFYWVMQTLGYRKFYYDIAFQRGINLASFDGWDWRPKYPKGTYRELRIGWGYFGYGVDK